jgi:hypothetical protein
VSIFVIPEGDPGQNNVQSKSDIIRIRAYPKINFLKILILYGISFDRLRMKI